VLRSLASSSGGQFFEDPEVLDETLASLDVAKLEEERVRYRKLWQNALIISCLMAFLSIEWAIRKWRNMP
jgi:hypothetical protein